MLRIGCLIAAVIGSFCLTAAAADQPEASAWQVVVGNTQPYRDAAEKEIVACGRMIAEDHGKPGVAYLRPPMVYFVQTASAKLRLGPPMDGLFGSLANKTVEVKGKMRPLTDGAKEQFLWVGWIRQAAPAPASQPEDVKFGQPVNGLRLGVAAKLDFIGGKLTAQVVMENVSDKPILVLPLLVHNATVFFEVAAPDGAKVPYRGPMLDWDVPDYDQAVQELAPGKSLDKTLSLAGYVISKPGKYTVVAIYRWPNAAPPPGRKPAVWTRGPIWTGELRSGQDAFDTADQTRQRPPASQPAQLPQGVTGQVLKLSGNFMPGPGPQPGGSRTPLAVPVYVFAGKVKMVAKPDAKHPALVRVVRADKEGRFKIPLPPGVYTVVAEIDGKLYLNSFQGDGTWTTVQVKPNAWTQWVIQDTSDAAF